SIPISLYLSDRLIDAPGRRTALLLAVTVAATAANSLYALALVGIIIGVVMVAAMITRRWRSAIWIGGAAVTGLLLPYRQLAAAGVIRPIESVAQFSATLGGYLYSPSRLHAGWSASFFDR